MYITKFAILTIFCVQFSGIKSIHIAVNSSIFPTETLVLTKQ